MKKIKILFFIHQLNSGGSQRIILNIVSSLNKKKYDVILVVINKIGEFSDFSHPGVKIIDLKTLHMRKSIFKILNVIYRENPDIVFSGLSILNLLFSFFIPLIKLKKDIKFVARETNTLSMSNKTQKFTTILNILYKIFYKNFDLIIAQSQFMKLDLINNFNVPLSKLIVINNLVDISYIEKNLRKNVETFHRDKNQIYLLSIGRLHKNKGFDLLLKMFANLDNKYHLVILGEGKERHNLEKLANQLGIYSRVQFLGFQKNPYRYMQSSDIVLITSRYEGFPNIVLESNVCGKPVIGFEAPGVSSEVIVNDLNGCLIKNFNLNEMKKAIEKTVMKPFNSEKIKNHVVNKFHVDKIILEYENIFSNLINEGIE